MEDLITADVRKRQMVSFKLGPEEFGIDILKVQEIIRYRNVTQVPETSESIEGVINLRGNVIPVIDLRKKFNLKVKENDDRTRIMVVNAEEKMIGLIVDAMGKVLRISEDQIEAPPEIGSGTIKEYLLGVGKLERGLIIILDLDKILSTEEIIELEHLDQIKSEIEKKMRDDAKGEPRVEEKPEKRDEKDTGKSKQEVKKKTSVKKATGKKIKKPVKDQDKVEVNIK